MQPLIFTDRRELPSQFRHRLAIAFGTVLVFFGLMTTRLWHLQIAEGEQYRSLSENNRIRLRRVRATRGTIVDRNGQVLVDNRPSFDLVLVPEDAGDVPVTIAALNKLLGAKAGDLAGAVAAAARRPPFEEVILQRDLDWNSLVVLETHHFELPGVSVQVGPRRTYPFGETAAHLLGYVGEVNQQDLASRRGYHLGDLIGKSGTERYWEQYLRGIDGGEQVEVDAAGRRLRVLSEVEETPGHNLVLTLDRDLQLAAEEAMEDRDGAIVALDPRTGEVLAMVSRPAFDPNVFARGIRTAEWRALLDNSKRPLNSKAVQGTYPPGSVFKVVMAAAALDQGVINPFTRIPCAGGLFFVNRTFRCWRKGGHGSMNVHEALVQSCDVFFYQVGHRLGIDTIAEYAHRFGLGEPTGIGLEHESRGIMPSSAWKRQRFGESWYAGETLSVAIGQGYVTTTPLQMAVMIAAVANDGKLFRPRFVKRVEAADGSTVLDQQPEPVGQLGLKPSTLVQLRDALSDVVNSNRGTGSRARLATVEVAGKTGTSQVGRLGPERVKQQALPRERRDHAWFAAFAPTASPEIVIAVLVEHAGEGGGAVAAPIARKVLAHYFGIPESKDATVRQTARLPF